MIDTWYNELEDDVRFIHVLIVCFFGFIMILSPAGGNNIVDGGIIIVLSSIKQ